jgi:hypothetical protein
LEKSGREPVWIIASYTKLTTFIETDMKYFISALAGFSLSYPQSIDPKPLVQAETELGMNDEVQGDGSLH